MTAQAKSSELGKGSAAVPNPVLAAAAQLFVERGYQGTSVADIARQAGVSVGTVYNNFDAKADILLALFRRYDQRQQERVRDAIATARSAGVDDPLQFFIAGTHGYLVGVWRERALSALFTTIMATDVDPSAIREVQDAWPQRNARLLGLGGGTIATQAVDDTLTGAIGGWVRRVQDCATEGEALAYIAEVTTLERELIGLLSR